MYEATLSYKDVERVAHACLARRRGADHESIIEGLGDLAGGHALKIRFAVAAQVCVMDDKDIPQYCCRMFAFMILPREMHRVPAGVYKDMLQSAFGTLRYILGHPLNRGRQLQALGRWFRWQVGSRLVPGPICVPFVNETMLVVRPGMTGATQNVYCGLADCMEMAFVLHSLRESDVFLDVGANVGAYTLLASGAVGATTIAIEPIAESAGALSRNVNLNGCAARVHLHRVAVGETPGTLSMTTSHGTMNHVVEGGGNTVPVMTLDEICRGVAPAVLKIDIEGYEVPCLRGAQSVLASGNLNAIIIELNGSGERYGYHDRDVHDILMKFGFMPYLYDPFVRSFQSLGTSIEAASGKNVLYIRDLAAARARVAAAPVFKLGTGATI
eukprot:gene27056-29810_t